MRDDRCRLRPGDLAFCARTRDLSDLANLMRAPDRTLIALALLVMIADRSPIRDRYLAIEASIVALATALVMWVAIIEPALTRSPLDSSGRLLSLSLPASDLVLVALGARLSLGYRARSRSFVALQLALVTRFAADMMNYWGAVGTSRVSSISSTPSPHSRSASSCGRRWTDITASLLSLPTRRYV